MNSQDPITLIFLKLNIFIGFFNTCSTNTVLRTRSGWDSNSGFCGCRVLLGLLSSRESRYTFPKQGSIMRPQNPYQMMVVAFQPPAIPQFYSLPCSLDYRKRANSPGWLQSATKFLLSHNLGWLQPASFFIVFWIACMVKNITISIFRTKLPTSLDLYRWLFQQWSISNSILIICSITRFDIYTRWNPQNSSELLYILLSHWLQPYPNQPGPCVCIYDTNIGAHMEGLHGGAPSL